MKATRVARAVALTFALAALVLVACGGGGKRRSTDGGVKDGGGNLDAGGDSGGGLLRRRDAQVTGGDPVPTCNRFDPMPCGAGQQCRIVIRRSADAGQFTIYSGCVEDVPSRSLGSPCDQFGGTSKPYTAPGLTDELYVDPCDPGLFCAPDIKIRGHYTCQTSCESGRRSGQTEVVDCPSASQYCTAPSMATGLEEVCRDSDVCDPSDPTSCGPGKGCYLRLNDAATGVISVCLPSNPMPIANGAMCQYINDCNPGSSCFGPVRLPPSRWQDTDLICRRGCLTSGQPSNASDAGDDEDGGVGPGGCRSSQVCASFAGSGLGLSSVSVPLGQCE